MLTVVQALKAPLLADYDSNATGRGLAKAAQGVRVQYGVSHASSRQQPDSLEFASPATTVRLEKGKHY